jgi:hypothetical protein
MPESALHAAAAELLAIAAPKTVRAVLRLLLDEPAPAQIAPAVHPRTVRVPQPTARKRVARRAAANSAADPEWEALRQQVRAAMRERGTTCEQLTNATGVSTVTARVSTGRRRPATQRLQGALRSWLEDTPSQAPEVAAPAAPFRGGGQRRNGSSTAATPSLMPRNGGKIEGTQPMVMMDRAHG